MTHPVEHHQGRNAGLLAAMWRTSRRVAGALGPGVACHRRASIALVGAAVIATLASLTAVAVDLGTAYLAKVTDQRSADSAAYAGALAYNASGSAATMNVGRRQPCRAERPARRRGGRQPGRLAQRRRQQRRGGDRDHHVAALPGRDIPEQDDSVGVGDLLCGGQAERIGLHHRAAAESLRRGAERWHQRDRRLMRGRLQLRRFGAMRHDDHHQDAGLQFRRRAKSALRRHQATGRNRLGEHRQGRHSGSVGRERRGGSRIHPSGQRRQPGVAIRTNLSRPAPA